MRSMQVNSVKKKRGIIFAFWLAKVFETQFMNLSTINLFEKLMLSGDHFTIEFL